MNLLKSDLAVLLAAYGDDGTGYLQRFLELFAVVDDPFDRDEMRGHVTASALIVNETRDRTLLIHHRKLDRWLQPGGHVEAEHDNSMLEAALREAREETGLGSLIPANSAIHDLDIHTIPARGHVPRHDHYDVRFLFVAKESDSTARTEEVTDLAWFSLMEARALDTDGTIRRLIEKL